MNIIKMTRINIPVGTLYEGKHIKPDFRPKGSDIPYQATILVDREGRPYTSVINLQIYEGGLHFIQGEHTIKRIYSGLNQDGVDLVDRLVKQHKEVVKSGDRVQEHKFALEAVLQHIGMRLIEEDERNNGTEIRHEIEVSE